MDIEVLRQSPEARHTMPCATLGVPGYAGILA